LGTLADAVSEEFEIQKQEPAEIERQVGFLKTKVEHLQMN
jgi:hypothetical protein